jgi:hypothetical protein
MWQVFLASQQSTGEKIITLYSDCYTLKGQQEADWTENTVSTPGRAQHKLLLSFF